MSRILIRCALPMQHRGGGDFTLWRLPQRHAGQLRQWISSAEDNGAAVCSMLNQSGLPRGLVLSGSNISQRQSTVNQDCLSLPDLAIMETRSSNAKRKLPKADSVRRRS